MTDETTRPLELELLTAQDMKELLAQRHGVLVGDDDPILMYVTLHNAFLEQYELLLQKHGQAVTSFMKSVAAKQAEDMEAHKRALLSKAVRANMENTVKEIVMHKTSMNEFLNELQRHASMVKLCTITAAVAAFIAAVCFVATVWRF